MTKFGFDAHTIMVISEYSKNDTLFLRFIEKWLAVQLN